MEFNIISEGLTDQIIIEAILQGHLKSVDLILNPLQPKKDQPGGWHLVVDYCKSSDFKESLPYSDGITIIHIDCDVLKGEAIPEDCYMSFNGLSTPEIFEMVKAKLIEFITPEVFTHCADRVVFAIAVDDIECWLLPIYFPNRKTTCNKISGCIATLNPRLVAEHDFFIDDKDPENYKIMAKALKKNKTVKHCYDRNESFALFIDSLSSAIASL